MNSNLITLTSFYFPSSIIKFPMYPSFSHKSQPKPPLFRFLPSLSTFSYKVDVNYSMGNGDSRGMLGYESEELIIEACLSRTLPPALTLEHGIESLKEAVEELKLNPPTCTSGMIRFEVAVPPGAYALNWFCCQPESPRVFPQFYVSKELENPTCDSAFVSKKYGVFGIGAAVDFNFSSSNSEKWNSFRRYLLVDSLNMTAYGFMGINYDIQSFIVKYETGCTYFVIPQVELSEDEGFCMLSGTLVWNDCFLRNFDQALHSYEISLVQARDHIPHTPESSKANFIDPSTNKFHMVEQEKVEMIYMKAAVLGSCDSVEFHMEPKSRSSSSQFCIRLSPETAVSANLLSPGGATCSILQDCANINSVWASLIVEECSRLGLTYFCIGPGSRSSPLAVAASTHPHVTCISCYDERSLAFHAVGYARGSQTPAVVITTSGTAVSNLFPAVVEASQDFVPLVLLTADRPQELLATGANQAIDQVNHFGSYVRFFFNLPVPDDDVTARMVLTTVDSAFYWATRSPYGPVHINCPFREPLDNSPRSWKKGCLDGLDSWITSTRPFTKYIQLQSSFTHNVAPCLTTDDEKVIQNGRHGLLVIGSIHRECDIWAAVHLARHLLWPIVTDILSGLRLRRMLTSYPEYEENLVFLDHFDHMLLCDSVRQWMQPDVIIQVGSRITSKRISSMLEQCFPCSYIMVDRHPCRHDPMHIVTHRIQSTVSEFVGYLLKRTLPSLNSRWSSFLRVVNSLVTWELSFQISSEYSLTEPHVAHALSDALASDTALFIGNSMPIRDADMYARGVVDSVGTGFQLALPCHWINVAGNRGASGIDGLLSTAAGFAVGCKKRVLCVIGDISFLHDTNGLAIISSRMWRKPMSIIVVNNRGGGIFSFLPIAEKTEPQIMEKYFYYSHDISISKLCAAHGVKHIFAKTKQELREALLTSQQEDADCVIEAVSSIDSNAIFHSILRKCASQTASISLATLMQLSVSKSVQDDFCLCKIAKVECLLYEVKLSAPPTSTLVSGGRSTLKRGFILEVTLDDGSTGFGEIAPLEMQKETLQDVEEQLMFLLHALKGAAINSFLPLLRESFFSWIWGVIGVPPIFIFPSVRCGLEMAILNALAAKHNCSLLDLLWPQPDKGDPIIKQPPSIDICALVDSERNPAEVANIVSTLVEEGFRAVKLKVARRDDPTEDAIVIKEIRRKLGSQIELRVDANRKWTYQQAITFGSLVKDCALQYIEEPVQSADDIVKFCEETGIPVALDETIDNIDGNICDFLARFNHPGIVALVIKPSFVGGFENAEVISHWAHSKGKLAVVSSAFESSLSLSSYVQFACYLEMRRAEVSHTLDKNMEKGIAHGLGTYKWLKEDVTQKPLIIRRQSHNGYSGAAINDADYALRKFQTNPDVILKNIVDNHVSTYQQMVELKHSSYLIKVRETGETSEDNVLLFLHGFLGTSEDWIPVMKTLSRSAKCIAVDLPGHGRSKLQSCSSSIAAKDKKLSIEVVSAILIELIDKIIPGKVTLVGYSMGARIALYMALRLGGKIDRAIVISGSPGLNDPMERKIRAAKDDSRARSLVSFGLAPFLNSWYRTDLWQSFREHPSFKKNVANRLQHDDVNGIAKALSDLSVGRQPPLWEDLKHCSTPLLLIVGEKDEKFKRISRDMCDKINQDIYHEAVEVPDAGHAAHLENPLVVARLVRQFLTKTSK